MLKAKKANKVYSILESEKQRYLNDGYEIIDNKGKVVESKKLTLEQKVKRLEKENKELKDQLSAKK